MTEQGLAKMNSVANSHNKFGDGYALTPGRMTKTATIARRFLRRENDEDAASQAELAVLKSGVSVDAGAVVGLRKNNK